MSFKSIMREEREATERPDGRPVGRPRKAGYKHFGYQFKLRDDRDATSVWSTRGPKDWRVGHSWYLTAFRRDAAVRMLNRNGTLYRYRPYNR